MERCLICHRKLRDSESIARKIGPTCWKRIEKVAKEEKAKRKARLKLKNNQIKGQISLFEMEGNYEREKDNK